MDESNIEDPENITDFFSFTEEISIQTIIPNIIFTIPEINEYLFSLNVNTHPKRLTKKAITPSDQDIPVS